MDKATKTAERATLGAALWHPRDQRRVNTIVTSSDYWYPAHAALHDALAALDDLQAPALVDYQHTIDLWPITYPSTLNMRIGAAYTMCDQWPLWALQRLAGCATGVLERDAREVVTRRALRDEATNLRARLAEIEQA